MTAEDVVIFTLLCHAITPYTITDYLRHTTRRASAPFTIRCWHVLHTPRVYAFVLFISIIQHAIEFFVDISLWSLFFFLLMFSLTLLII